MDAKMVCLGALMFDSATGYEIRKLCTDGPFGSIHHIGFGSIYPALNRLVNEGLATFVEQSQDKRPDKKVYSITGKGRSYFIKNLNKSPANDAYKSEALFGLMFANKLDIDHVQELLEFYRGQALKHVERMDSTPVKDNDFGHQFVRGLGYAVQKTMIDYIDSAGPELVAALQEHKGKDHE